jgi:hypothetical protein
MLHTARARAFAKLGRVQETLHAVGLADEAFADKVPSNDPPWMSYYDHAQHHGDTGHALFDLAVHGEFYGEATSRLSTAVQGHSDSYTRSRAISATKLATLTMTSGDPVEAAAIGSQAVNDAGQLRSQRALTCLTELDQAAKRYTAISTVGDLRATIGERTGGQ